MVGGGGAALETLLVGLQAHVGARFLGGCLGLRVGWWWGSFIDLTRWAIGPRGSARVLFGGVLGGL